MISLIICSRDPTSLAAVSESVSHTIGVEYEIIAIDNSGNQYGICQAYNRGAQQSRYDILCFMHEDLQFQTANWGQIVATILADVTIGVLGVAGGRYQPKVPAGYWGTGQEYLCMNVLHQALPTAAPVLDVSNPTDQSLADVVVVDGLWMCARREVWQQYPFDEQTFPGFHFYDVDFSTAVFQKLRVCVTYEVLMTHFSKGSVNKQWALAALDYQRKWAAQLPLSVADITRTEQVEIDRQAALDFINLMLEEGLPTATVRQELGQLLTLKNINREVLGLTRKVIWQRYFSNRKP